MVDRDTVEPVRGGPGFHVPVGSFATLLIGVVAALPTMADSSPFAEGFGEPAGEVILRVSGDIEHVNVGDEAHLDRRSLERLPERNLETHTSVTDGPQRFEGVLVRDLLEALGAPRSGEVRARALNDYLIDIPIQDFHDYDVIVAHTQDGQRLTPRDKGPLWIVYPRDDHEELVDIRYDYRWVWQLERLDVR